MRQGGLFGIGMAVLTPGVRTAVIPACGLTGIPLRVFLPGLALGSAVDLGLHLPDGLEVKIDQSIRLLSSNAYKEREDASKGLIQAGLIISRREGRNLYYSPNFERMNALVGFLRENCCNLAGEACGPDCEPRAATALRRKSA